MYFLNKVKNIFFKKNTIYVLFVLAVWIGILLTLCSGNITNPGLWFDEAGQFWLGKGLNHYSLPFSSAGDLSQVLKYNAGGFNLDPGGFSIIAHYWTIISNDIVFLKTLPFLFFLISMIIITKLCFLWKPKNLLVYFGGFILIISPLISQYVFEFRPYTMEMLITIIALYFCYKISNILNDWRYALFSGTVLAVLLTSRYSALFSIASLGILVFGVFVHRIFMRKISKDNIVNLVLFALPIMISVVLIYFFTLKYQNPTGLPPSYVTELMFKTSSVSSVLFHYQVLLTVLPFLILVFIYFISLFSNYIKEKVEPYRLFMWFAFVLNIIFITLSILGKYPWGINSRWDISTHAIFTIAWLPILFMISDFLYKKNNYLFKFLQVFFVLFFIYHIFGLAKDFKYNSLDSTYTNFKSIEIPLDSKILVNVGADPTIRYLFEYGLLSDEKYKYIYNNISLFNHAEYTHLNSINNLKSIDKYDYIILTMFNWDNSEIKNILGNKVNWVDVSKEGPSKMFKNTSSN
jgi:hypothetical protein